MPVDSINTQLRPRFLNELRPGTRIISHAFGMGDWQADDHVEMGHVNIYKWVVPAQIAGSWEWNGADGTPYRVDLQQKYQEITGSAWLADSPAHLNSALLCGNQLDLEIAHPDLPEPRHFTLSFENRELMSVWEID